MPSGDQCACLQSVLREATLSGAHNSADLTTRLVLTRVLTLVHGPWCLHSGPEYIIQCEKLQLLPQLLEVPKLLLQLLLLL